MLLIVLEVIFLGFLNTPVYHNTLIPPKSIVADVLIQTGAVMVDGGFLAFQVGGLKTVALIYNLGNTDVR